MRASTLFMLTVASAAGYAAAYHLMGMDDAALEGLPEPVRGPAGELRGRLQRLRARVEAGWREGTAERESAEHDLMQEYHRRSGHR